MRKIWLAAAFLILLLAALDGPVFPCDSIIRRGDIFSNIFPAHGAAMRSRNFY
jgi:hypothetical protein